MRITKSMANTAAMLMASKKYDPVVKQAKDRLNSIVLGVMEILPQEILTVCPMYPKVFYVTKDVYYRWNGTSYHVTLPFNVPSSIRSLSDGFYSIEMKMHIQKPIEEACQAIFKAECERKNLEERIEQILIGLRTRKKIESDFPEASKFIEWPEEKQVPAVPVPNEIRKLFQGK